MRSLLDVSTLLALLDSDHIHHNRAKSWLISEENRDWASCPITQNGFVRVISQSSYPNPISVFHAVRLFGSAAGTSFHEFWADDLSLLDDSIDHTRIHGPKQLTDAYLLALAIKHKGRLVALDRSIDRLAVRGATPDHLVLL